MVLNTNQQVRQIAQPPTLYLLATSACNLPARLQQVGKTSSFQSVHGVAVMNMYGLLHVVEVPNRTN